MPVQHTNSTATRRRAGISLVECVAAMAIIGTSLVAGLSLFSMHHQTCALGNDAWRAHRYLVRELERVHGTDFDSLASSGFAPIEENTAFRTRRVVTNLASDVREVTVEVSWTTPQGVSRSDSATTLRCEEGF